MSLTASNLEPQPDWYVLTDTGDLTLRIVSGLRIGEDTGGELALNAPLQSGRWLAFEIDDDGSLWLRNLFPDEPLWLRSLGDSAAAAGAVRSQSERLPLEPGTLIELPNNRLHISQGFQRHGSIPQIAEYRPAASAAPPLKTQGTGLPEAWPDRFDPTRELDHERPVFSTEEVEAVLGPVRDPEDASNEAIVTPNVTPAARHTRQFSRQAEAAAPNHLYRWVLITILVLGVAMAAVIAISQAQRVQNARSSAVPAATSQSQAAPASPTTAEPGSAPPPVTPVLTTSTPAEPESLFRPDEGPPSASVSATAEQSPEPLTAPAETTEAFGSATESAPVDAVAQQALLERRLALARQYFTEGYLTAPLGNNVIALVRRVLVDDPDNAEALDLTQRTADRLVAVAVEAQEAGLAFEARNLLEEVLAFHPEHLSARRLWNLWVYGRESLPPAAPSEAGIDIASPAPAAADQPAASTTAPDPALD